MRFIAHALVLALVSLAACGGGPDDAVDADEATTDGVETAPDAGDTAAAGGTGGASGQAIYAANCATCHGEGGRGDGPAAVGLEPPPADLTDGVWVTGDGSLPAIVNVVANGSPGTAMIGWRGTLSDAEIEAVAAHVQSLGR
jgi:mono/diheme cytochrome c family protein